MSAVTAALCSACLSLALVGCTRDPSAVENQPPLGKREAAEKREILGEIFTLDGNVIVKQSGAMIYFLIPSERDKFDALVTEWRKGQYKNDQDSWDRDNKQYSELFESSKNEDGKVYDQDTIRTLNSINFRMQDTKRRIELKEYDSQISLGFQAIKEFLQSTHRTAADSEGRFKVILPLAQECWVVAESERRPFRDWYFRWVPDGANLALSDGNAMRRAY